jgi:hypothetical protein
MQYLCLIYHDEATLAALSEDEYDALADEVRACREELRRGGHDLAPLALAFVRAATTVRVRGGTVAVTAGPFAEATGLLGGFALIEARDLNEAIRLAARLPRARAGSVEVRPIEEFAPR